MENSRELISISRQVVFDTTNYGYGYWEVNMRTIVPEMNEDAWTVVESSWEDPKKWKMKGTQLSNQKLSGLKMIIDSKFISKALGQFNLGFPP